MKKISALILTIVLFGVAGNSSATSPMPEESKPAQTTHVCSIHLVYNLDKARGVLMEEANSTLTFESSISKKNVLDKITQYINDKLNDGNTSEFELKCKFAKQ